MDDIISRVLPALLPGVPTFSRSRWAGFEDALCQCGLLFALNTVMVDVVPVWVRELSNSAKPACMEDFALDLGARQSDYRDMLIRGFPLLTLGLLGGVDAVGPARAGLLTA